MPPLEAGAEVNRQFSGYTGVWCRYIMATTYTQQLQGVVALHAETQPGLEGAKRLLEPLAESKDLTVLEDPSFFQAGQAAQEAKVDFVIGSIQDKPLYEGLGLAHINLGPFYFFNQFNFVPCPYAGVRGVLNLFSEMARVAQDAFFERQSWKERGYCGGQG